MLQLLGVGRCASWLLLLLLLRQLLYLTCDVRLVTRGAACPAGTSNALTTQSSLSACLSEPASGAPIWR